MERYASERLPSHVTNKNKLCEVKARMFNGPAAFENPRTPSADEWMQLQIVDKKKDFFQDSNGIELAILSQKASDDLRCLERVGPVCYIEAYVKAQEWITHISTAKGTGNMAMVEIEINVNGPLNMADEVGRTLSKANLFLQPPSVLDIGTIYHNPHAIHFPEIQDCAPMANIPNAPELVAASTRKLDLQDVFGGLDQSGDLESITVDERLIRTKLRE